MNRDIYFISDAHVGSRDHEAEIIKEKNLAHFFNFLATLSPPPLLYILGDLFDFWFEYKYAIPSVYQKLLTRLVQLTEKGIEIRYVTGNHDFWIRDFFQKHLGIEVYHGAHIFETESKKFYLFHGDGVLSEDKGYRILKKIIQSPLTIKMYQWIHPDIGIPIARWASATSRDHYGKDPEIEKRDDRKYINYAFEILENNYDYMLMGHTHRPLKVEKESKTYINLGDWIRNFTFGQFKENKLKLFQLDRENSKEDFRFKEIKPDQKNLSETFIK